MRNFMIILILSGFTILSSWTGVAFGHAMPNNTEPKVGETVNASPKQVRIWFDSPLKPAISTILVQNTSGRQVDKGDGQVDSSDATLLGVSLPLLPPGTYRVIWNVVASDGHQTEGEYSFNIK
ncbi:MAG: copper resistance CopC family protein [Thermodesulfobacteriota bacterium]